MAAGRAAVQSGCWVQVLTDLQDLLFNGVSLQADVSCSLASLFKSVFVDVHTFCVNIQCSFWELAAKHCI